MLSDNTEPPGANGAGRKPDQSYGLYSDRTTQLEVAIWENEVRYDDKVSVQHSIVLSRSYRNAEGKWVPSTAYRTHDLPLVRFLMDKAHAWCADRRTHDSSCPFLHDSPRRVALRPLATGDYTRPKRAEASARWIAPSTQLPGPGRFARIGCWRTEVALDVQGGG